MEDLFRFFLVRPATQTGAEDALTLNEPTPAIQRLVQAGADGGRGARKRAAAALAGQGFVDNVDKLALGAKLKALRDRIGSPPGDAVSTQDVRSAVTDIFGAPPAQVVATAEFKADIASLWDAIVLIKLVPSQQNKPLAALLDALRVLRVIADLGDDDSTLSEAGGMRRALTRPVLLPSRLFAPPAPVPAPPAPAVIDPGGMGDRLDAATNEARLLSGALDDLLSLEPSSFHDDPPPEPDVVATPTDPAREREAAALYKGRGASGAFVPPKAREKLFTLKEDALATLSPEHQEVVRKATGIGVDLPVDRLAGRLERRLKQLAVDIDALTPKSPVTKVVALGPTIMECTVPTPQPGPPPPTSALSIPDTHGSFKPAGIADLLIVKQVLKRYQAREIAHIENVLKGEAKIREHKRATTIEEVIVNEIERTTEEERELESTDRFELQRESQETVKEDTKLEAGVKVSASYGVGVDFEAYVNGAMAQSKERSIGFASTFAREVTSRASSKVTERVRKQVTRRLMSQVQETNTHTLSNIDGDEHIAGIYQWVEKVYEAQVFNYGLRTIYDITVPEPAALLINAVRSGAHDGHAIEKPADFTVQPDQISEWTYHQLVKLYGATDVKPPPERFVTVAKTFRNGPDSSESPTRGVFVDSAELAVPPNYEAVYGTAVLAGINFWDAPDEWSIGLAIGGRRHRFVTGGSWAWGTTLDAEGGSLPVALETWRVMNYSLAIEVKCARTSRALDQWKYETYTALLQSYERKLSAYNEAVAALRIAAGVAINGRSPVANEALQLNELKRAAISTLTAQHFDLFGAIDSGTLGLPEIDFAEAGTEGDYIRFFEQAFEWRNMTFVYYPYFWGRKENWNERLLAEDADPNFEAFLKAGAARLVVPVRPGFEAALDHFLTTGDTWQGGELPTIGSDLYVPIITEIEEQLGAPGSEVPQGDPWDVTLPTTLVYLRQQSSLPRWAKNGAGAWEPVEG